MELDDIQSIGIVVATLLALSANVALYMKSLPKKATRKRYRRYYAPGN